MRAVWVGRVCGLAIVGFGVALLIVAAVAQSTSSDSVGLVLAMVPWVGVGAFIVSTRPRNPIGWLFSAVGLLWLSGEVIYDWALGVTDPSDQFLPYGALFSDSYWIPGLGLLFVAVMLFPSGRLPSDGWRPAFVLVVAGLAIALARAALAVSVQAGNDGLVVDNPIGLGVVGFVETGDETPILIYLLCAAVTALSCFVTRFRRSRGVERQQLKWMALAVPALVTGWILAGFAEPWPLLANLVRAASMALVPIAAGLAITRFHLYDVDRVISRTTAYALVTGVLLGVYAAVVTSLTSLVPESRSSGAPDSWAVAIATLVAAGLFRPVLGWAQVLVNRRFNREQYDAGLAAEVFAREMRDEVEPEQVVGSLLAVVNRTVQPSGVALWLRGGAQ